MGKELYLSTQVSGERWEDEPYVDDSAQTPGDQAEPSLGWFGARKRSGTSFERLSTNISIFSPTRFARRPRSSTTWERASLRRPEGTIARPAQLRSVRESASFVGQSLSREYSSRTCLPEPVLPKGTHFPRSSLRNEPSSLRALTAWYELRRFGVGLHRWVQ